MYKDVLDCVKGMYHNECDPNDSTRCIDATYNIRENVADMVGM